MKQHEAILYVMERAGGEATLGHLYLQVPGVPGFTWETKTLDASIRRTVQMHPELFFKVRPGLWALTSRKREILDKYGSGKGKEESVHVLYQGLLVQLGNLDKYQTVVASQDRNRFYQGRPLKEHTVLLKSLPFSYAKFVDKAERIDVSWYNDRDMPSSFFEVEHSTDIEGALVKFTELQDFMARFHIVADESKRRQYESRLAQHLFKPIQGRVAFWNYEKVMRLHDLKSRLAAEEIA